MKIVDIDLDSLDKKEYEIYKFSSNLEMIRYQEGIIDDIQKLIYRIQSFIKELK